MSDSILAFFCAPGLTHFGVTRGSLILCIKWEFLTRRGLGRVRDEHGAQAVGVISSARLTVEENYLIQKLARGVVGTNSVHSCEGT